MASRKALAFFLLVFQHSTIPVFLIFLHMIKTIERTVKHETFLISDFKLFLANCHLNDE